MKAFNFVPLFLLLFCEATPKRIVFWHVTASLSHRIQTWPIAEALAREGHEVTYLTSIERLGTNPNITEIVPKSVSHVINHFINSDFDVSLRVEGKMQLLHKFMFEIAHNACETMLSSEEFQEWMKPKRKFDLFIIDSCYAECALGISKYLGAKSIIFSAISPIAYEYDGIGYLPQSGSVPELEVYTPTTPLTFFERLFNTYLTLIWRWKQYLYSFRIDELLKKYLKESLPHVGDLLRNINLVFHTGDVISDYGRSFPPLFVNVAGLHCRESTQALPKDMETFINSTKNDGFVYISLGSLVVAGNLPENIKQVFFDTIRAFPNVRFLWRWSGEMPKDIPDNLYVSKWFPQVDVLGHKKIKAFVTQNGRPSTLEAIYLGVPMISFPVLGDQDLNANRLSEVGATIKLDIVNVKFDEFRDALNKVLYDPGVKDKMKVFQDIFRNRPMPPVETALWWIDYVLKYEDTSHLRPAGYDQYWFVRRQVDVWAFVSITVFILILVITAILVILWKLLKLINEKQKDKKEKRE